MIAYKTLGDLGQSIVGLPDAYPGQMILLVDEADVERYRDELWTIVDDDTYADILKKFEVEVSIFENLKSPDNLGEYFLSEDEDKYFRRAQNVPKILSKIASENVARIRSGSMTVPELYDIMNRPAIKQAMYEIQLLSFEFAARTINAMDESVLPKHLRERILKIIMEHA